MLICSPAEAYHFCRRVNPVDVSWPFLQRALIALKLIAQFNGRPGSRYVAPSEFLSNVITAHGTHRPIHTCTGLRSRYQGLCPTSESKSDIKTRRGLPTSGSMIFSSVGSDLKKDADILLGTVNMLLSEGGNLWLLRWSGDYQALAESARKLGIGDRLIASDAVHAPKGLANDYRSSDLCVQASREVGLGFSVLEAMARGAPVVAADIAGLNETVVDGHTGWLYAVGEAKVLADCISLAIDDLFETDRRKADGREWFVNGLTEKRFSQTRKCSTRFQPLIAASLRVVSPRN